MTRVRFEPSGYQVEVRGPSALVDVLDELPGTDVRLGCRAAHCGACRVEVEAGAESLVPPLSDELETLKHLGASERERLACQVRLRAFGGKAVCLRVPGR